MKKRTKGIIAGSCAVVILAGVLIALKLTEPEEETDNIEESSSKSAETKSVLLYDSNPSDISKALITNENGGFTIERYADDFWTVPDISGQPLDYDSINGVINTLSSLTAEEVVNEAPDDLSIYGLAQPKLTADVIYDNGKIQEKKIYLGDVTPKGNCYYMRVDDSNTVYTVKSPALSALFEKEYYFIDHTLYENIVDDNTEDDYDPAKINSVTIKRNDLDYDIVLEYDIRQEDENITSGNSSTHVMTDPVSLDLNPDKCKEILNGIFGLSAIDVAAAAPDEAMLKEYGLDDPVCTVNYDINAGGVTLYIGNKHYSEEPAEENEDEDNKVPPMPDGYYVMKEGTDIVYIMNTSSVPWASIMPLDITTNVIVGIYIYTIDSIAVEYEGKTDRFELNRDKDNFAVKFNGSDFADTDSFKSFYQFILRAPAEEMYLDENTEEARIKITINHEYGETVLEFIPSEERKTIIRLDGRTSFKCRTVYADRIIENIKRLAAGEEIISSW